MLGTAGESNSNAVYRLDWSIGEVMTETYHNSNQMVTQGFHQGRYNVTVVQEYSGMAEKITIYPNPVEDFLNISAKGINTASCWCYLTDNNGTMLAKVQLEEDLRLPMAYYATGTYNLLIQQDNKFIKKFKIIKNK